MNKLQLPPGWTNPILEQQLTKYAVKSQKILEIGSFVGRSTAVICQAIKHSGKSIHFDTCDLHPKTSDEFQKCYANVYGKKINIPDLHLDFIKQGGSQTHLIKHLNERGLLNYVNCYRGDFMTLSQSGQLLPMYDLIYCDLTHDETEIKYNLPFVRNLLDPKRSVLICDNIIQPAQIDALVSLLALTDYKLIGTTFIGKIGIQSETGNDLNLDKQRKDLEKLKKKNDKLAKTLSTTTKRLPKPKDNLKPIISNSEVIDLFKSI